MEPINLITKIGSLLNVTWLIPTSILTNTTNFTCSLRLYKANSKIFNILQPLFEEISDSEGKFQCGVLMGQYLNSSYLLESKVFPIPSAIYCKTCVMQWVLYTSAGNFYQCSDLLIQPKTNLQDQCESKCSIGGSCNHGICVCYQGYSGTSCEISSQTTNFKLNENYSHTIEILFLIILIVLILLAVGVGVYFWKESEDKAKKEKMRLLEIEKNKILSKKTQYELGSYTRRAMTET